MKPLPNDLEYLLAMAYIHTPMDLNIELWALFQDEITPDLLHVHLYSVLTTVQYPHVPTLPMQPINALPVE